MKTRLAFSLIILVLQWAVAGAVYAQESIPETVKRHDQELKDMAGQIQLLKKVLDEKTKSIGQTDPTEFSPPEGGYSIYVSPPTPKPEGGAARCVSLAMKISVGTVEYDLTKIIVVKDLFLPEVPYYIRGTIKCSGWSSPIPCAASGTISVQPNRSYGYNFIRPDIDSCSIVPLT